MPPIIGNIQFERIPGSIESSDGPFSSYFQPGDKVGFIFDNISPSASNGALKRLALLPTSSLGNPLSYLNSGHPLFQSDMQIPTNTAIVNYTNSNFSSKGQNAGYANFGDSVAGTWRPTSISTVVPDVVYPLTTGTTNFNFCVFEFVDTVGWGYAITTITFSIPTIDSVFVVRCDVDGTENSDGKYLKVKADWPDTTLAASYQWGEYGSDLSNPISIIAQDTFMQPVGGGISKYKSYVVKVTVIDIANGTAVTKNAITVGQTEVVRTYHAHPYTGLGFLFLYFTMIHFGGQFPSEFRWYDIAPPPSYTLSAYPVGAFRLYSDNANYVEYSYGGRLSDLFDEIPDSYFSSPQQRADIKIRTLQRWPTDEVPLFRVPYRIALRVSSKENTTAEGINKATYDRYTLVSRENEQEILDNIFNYEMLGEIVSATVLLDNEQMGDIASIDTDFGLKTGYISKMDTNLHNRKIAKIEIRC